MKSVLLVLLSVIVGWVVGFTIGFTLYTLYDISDNAIMAITFGTVITFVVLTIRYLRSGSQNDLRTPTLKPGDRYYQPPS